MKFEELCFDRNELDQLFRNGSIGPKQYIAVTDDGYCLRAIIDHNVAHIGWNCLSLSVGTNTNDFPCRALTSNEFIACVSRFCVNWIDITVESISPDDNDSKLLIIIVGRVDNRLN